MGTTWTTILVGWLAWSQEQVLLALAAADPGVVRARLGSAAPSIAFHAWHLARWADRHQAAFGTWLEPGAEPRPEIWVAAGMSTAWGFDGIDLGPRSIGQGLDDDASAALPLPAVDVLTDYVAQAFAHAVDAIGRIPDDRVLHRRVVDLHGDEEPISEIVLGLLSHTDRHLGMMEALRGVAGERGTATI